MRDLVKTLATTGRPKMRITPKPSMPREENCSELTLDLLRVSRSKEKWGIHPRHVCGQAARAPVGKGRMVSGEVLAFGHLQAPASAKEPIFTLCQRASSIVPSVADRKSTRLNSSHANISYA